MSEIHIPTDRELKVLVQHLELTRDVKALARRIEALIVNVADFTGTHTKFAYLILAIANSPNRRIEMTDDSRRQLKTILLLLAKGSHGSGE